MHAMQTVPCFNVTTVGKMLNGKDMSDTSFIDHLIPRYSRHKFHPASPLSIQNEAYPPNERRFFFAKSSNGGGPQHHQISVEEEEEVQERQSTLQRNQLRSDNHSNHLNTAKRGGGAANTALTDRISINKATVVADASPDVGEDAELHQEEERRGVSATNSNPRTMFPFDLPQEFPLTRTVSTSTDMNQTSDSELNYCGIFMKHVVNKSTSSSSTAANTGSRRISTTTKGILKGQVVGGSSSGKATEDMPINQQNKKAATAGTAKQKRVALGRSKEDLFNEFCKKTGRLIKPKNIYYIDDRHRDHGHQDEEEEELQRLKDHIVVVNPREYQTRLSQQSLNQMRRSKSFQADLSQDHQPLYYSHFDRRAVSPRNLMMYQSQTLPRNFMKASQSQLQIPHISRQCVPGNGYVNHRSFDNFLNVMHTVESRYYPQQHHLHPLHQQQQQHNWPKCIPTSPSAFASRQSYGSGPPNRMGNMYQSASRESLGKVNVGGHEFGGGGGGAFDLDKIEQECRMSHASLFQGHNGVGFMTDYSKSTAV